MMMIECTYEFTPPGGEEAIRIHGMQPYSPGQARKAQVWEINVPDEYSARISNTEFDTWAVMLRTLAGIFCDGNEDAVAERLVRKFDQRPEL